MSKTPKYLIWVPVLLAITAMAGIGFGVRIGTDRQIRRTAFMQRGMGTSMPAIVDEGWHSSEYTDDKLMQTIEYIENYYVDPIACDSLYETVIPDLLHQLDPHSIYIPAEEFGAVNESLDGEFDGIGIVFNAATDTVIVMNVIPKGPSDKAGIRAGDRIMRIDDSLVAGRNIPQENIVKRLRGPRGSQVRLSLRRQDIADDVEVTVTRAAIELHSIDAAFMLVPEKHIGYVRLEQFSRTSHAELKQALSRLRGEGMTRLILDLRGNTGGFLDQAILIANEFLPKGKLIVYTEDRYRRQNKEFSNGLGRATDIALAVLVDEGSASSSEILAGALQDNDRGTIIGRRTFGKGLVQNQIPYPDGSALRLTVARYYTPTGRSIQKPYVNGDEESYQMDMVNRYYNNEFFSADSIRFADSLRFTTPAGRTVYGGGGIMPDIFIPMDTTGITRYYTEVWGRNILYRYTLDFCDRHRERINSVRSIDDLNRLLAGSNLMSDFIAYARARGVEPDYRDIAASHKLIEAQIRAYIGRNTPLEDNGFYANIYPIDNVIKSAVEELSDAEGTRVDQQYNRTEQ
ncbi:MAG: S41 family peptidase [Alistipes sp.]|nr:S41 family peptidase [Alistipes sp.]MDE7129309.1 S41 family peptidase [Alistipes sp.]